MRAALALLLVGGVAHADRAPVAVLWLGDATTLGDGARLVGEVNAALERVPNPQTARPLDSADDRRALVEGGPATRADAIIARAEAAMAKLKFADAAAAYLEAEKILLEEVPVGVTQRRLAAVERGLLASFDQLGKPEEAARAAERLSWTAGSNEDLALLVQKHQRDRRWEPALPPLQVTSVPSGAQVYRNLQPMGATPVSIPGGESAFDGLDVELAGHRRVHMALGSPIGGSALVELTLQKEERLGVLVDDLRAQAPEPPAGEVAALGRRLGAARVLVLSPDGPGKVRARFVEVAKAVWSDPPLRADAAGAPAMEQLAAYVAPGPPPGAVVAKAPPHKTEKPKSAWGKWYTWVAAAGVLVLVGTLLIVDNVGDDKLTVTAKH